jgi:uncharacterized phage-associated protein
MAADLAKLKNLILHIGANPHVQNLGETKLWKLIYFIDATSLRETGRSLTGSDFIKYDHGPVPSRGEKSLKQLSRNGDIDIVQEQFPSFRINRVVATTPPVKELFSVAELKLIGRICRAYGDKTAAYLSELSHLEPAWHYAERLNKLSPDLMLYGAAEDPEDL